MKKAFSVLMLLIVLTNMTLGAKEIEEFVLIKGKVTYEVQFNEIKLQRVQEGELVTVATTTLGDNGTFAFMWPVEEAGFYHISIPKNSNMLRFYVENGLELDLTIEKNNYKLDGEAIGHNQTVTDWNIYIRQLLEINSLASGKTYMDFFPLMENEFIEKAAAFKGGIQTGDADFDALMKLTVQTDLEEQAYNFWRFPRSAHPEKESYPDFYDAWVKEPKFSNADILKLWNGKSYMENYFMVNNFILADTKPSDPNDLTPVIKGITDPVLRDVYLRGFFSKSRFKGGQYEKAMSVARPYMTSEKSKTLIVELEKKLFSEVGQPGFQFEYEDIDGNLVSFDSFKGKVVYLDVWATWCGPCIQQIPYLKKLEEELHKEDIVFLSISIDELKDKEKWKNFVKEKELKGVQLMADEAWKSGLVQNYGIKGIPRFMIFDKEGNIVTTDAMRPSQPELKPQLMELLEK